MIDECSQTIERKEIVDLFPNLELEEVFKEYSHLSTDALAHLILEKRNQIPVKKKTPGLHTRILLKTYNGTLAAIGTITNCIPNWLGGRTFCNVVKAFEYKTENNRRFYGLKETLECCVCWEDLPVTEMCFCDSLVSVKPGFSENTAAKETHNFCRSCLEQHAIATMEEMPLAKGGLGLQCMMIDCENPITFQEIGAFISADLMKKLEERASELCVIQAALNYMERCKKCNCAVELEKSPQQLQIFTCPEKDCKYKFCRLCEEQWDEEHIGISCEEFIRRNGRARFLEKRLSEAVFRNCPKCKLAFVKWDGCNKITCKCGQTQCYICRKDNIGYNHFCTCLGSKRTADGNFHCKKCNCDCLLWENAAPVEKRQMEQIRAEVAEKEKKKAAKGKKNNKP